MKPAIELNATKAKYIGILCVKRLLIYLAVSTVACSMIFDEMNSMRNQVYGIGNYVNSGFVSGMLIVANIIFIIIFIMFLFKMRKHLYKLGNSNTDKLKEYVKFETILEISITLGYVLVTSFATIFIDNYCITGGLIVPIYCMFAIFENIIIAVLLSVLLYLILIFAFLVVPYFNTKPAKTRGKRNVA